MFICQLFVVVSGNILPSSYPLPPFICKAHSYIQYIIPVRFAKTNFLSCEECVNRICSVFGLRVSKSNTRNKSIIGSRGTIAQLDGFISDKFKFAFSLRILSENQRELSEYQLNKIQENIFFKGKLLVQERKL